ncbi:MAG: histidinol-phosphate transaminase [Alphaproteobacteria bacterium]|nr:histidinol-phosphate transaminase [Alphaproteobacteria bacterium]
MSGPIPVPGILDIKPYVGGRASAPGAARVFKLSSNETPLGPSAKALAAYHAAAERLFFYPEGSSAILREAIAEVEGLPAQQIVCGNGSDEFLHLLPLIFCNPGDEVLYSAHGFAVYRIAALTASATPVVAPERACVTDVDAMLARVSEKTKIVFIANPNNPTGTYIPASEVERLHRGLPSQTLLVIDAAYAEYVTASDYECGRALVEAAPNVVMTRTFSKIHGLAALRAGWMYAPPAIIDIVNRVRAPFNVSTPAQMAAAAAIRDQEHVALARAHNARWLKHLSLGLRAIGLQVEDSAANFVLVHFPDRPGLTAGDADAFLMKRGLILRRVADYGFPNSLRLTVGTEEANGLVLAALGEFMGGAP